MPEAWSAFGTGDMVFSFDKTRKKSEKSGFLKKITDFSKEMAI
jgi:hypothetical protein